MLRLDDTKARVLVIDASAHMRRLVITLMTAVGVRFCEEARTTIQAATMILKNLPDLIVIDLSGDATEALLFVHRLRRGEFGDRHTPVLGISSSGHHAMLELAWESGVDEMIGKPISAIEVIQRAGALLAESARRGGAARSAAE
ncbi:response regulator [Magnetospirillum sulfuroxidans]|uniref:Response regulator n=1 Tax=Magnetospirillum sulfuroxidans TaxID=611300 RepID=A0ABS5IGR8_9PROT|nr:response regulator [Magnetospirillum sulfuroxidans]MBR9972938.1 response regulator [Magnetospirillum sulfuroxidans]